MLLQCQILVLNNAKASHNEVHAFGSELYSLCFTVFFYSVFPVTLMRAGLPYTGMPARAHSTVPVPSPTLLRHHCALLSASGITVSTIDGIKDGWSLCDITHWFMDCRSEASSLGFDIFTILKLDVNMTCQDGGVGRS